MVDLRRARATSGTPATPRPMASSATPRSLLARDLLKLDHLFDDPHAIRSSAARRSRRRCSRPGVSRNVTPPVGQGGARRPQHAGLDPRRDRRACCERSLELDGGRDLAPAGAVRDAGRLRGCSPPRGGSARRRRRSAARPAPTGSSSARPTPSSAGPGTSRRSHTPDEYVDLPEVTAARRFYADVVARVPRPGD